MGIPKKSEFTEKQREIAKKMQKSVLLFIRMMWKLRPQPVKEKYQKRVQKLIKEKRYQDFQEKFFEPFVKGKHITWQQYQLLLAVEDAANGEGQKRISVSAGHGVGKSCALSWIIIWFLYTRPRSQVPCTAPSVEQMYDVLWKEASKWIGKMPEGHKEKFDVQSQYIRITEKPMEWFARAKTARKENPEALAGVHGKYVLLVVDEASGVADEIYETGEGSLTEDNYIMILISNHTRLTGYFHKTQTDERVKKRWNIFRFNSEESPVVSNEYVEGILADTRGDKSDDKYRVRVLGLPPKGEGVDKKGYVPLLLENDIRMIQDIANDDFVGYKKLGVDPAGEGKNTTEWVLRDDFKAKVILSEKISNSKSIAQKTITLAHMFDLDEEDIIVDMFGEGAETVKELALAGWDVLSPNVGNKPEDKEDYKIYLNQRACFYFRMKEWVRKGGEIIEDRRLKDELLQIKYRMGLSGKIQIMSKRDMINEGFKSPDRADALMLTFADVEERQRVIKTYTASMLGQKSDPYKAI